MKKRKISIQNPQGEKFFYDGPENDYGIYTRFPTVKDKNIVRAGKGKKHINFLKEDEDEERSVNSSNKHNNTRKYNSKQSNLNLGFTMDNINELDEDSFLDEAGTQGKESTPNKANQSNWDPRYSFSENTNKETNESRGDLLNLSEYNKNYNKKLSSNLYISLSRKISSLKQTLSKKKKKTIKENKDEYIEQLHRLIRHQGRRIRKLEEGDMSIMPQVRQKVIDRVEHVTDKFHLLEFLILEMLDK